MADALYLDSKTADLPTYVRSKYLQPPPFVSCRELKVRAEFDEIVGESPALTTALHLLSIVAPTDSSVLILGETGTGKELVARAAHTLSGRSQRPFVKLNCAAIPVGLLESELFGHEKGAFTGAVAQKPGRFELADKGTLFLDEIGDMNPVTQAKVLRAIENRKIERLGGSQSIDIDVRIVSATHLNLLEQIARGRFREDLYFRLRVVTLDLPALREHKDDLPLLIEIFLEQLGERHKRHTRASREAIETLRQYDWPGNVRELRNALERALVLAEDDQITVNDLPEEIRRGKAFPSASSDGGGDTFMGETDFREAKRKFEIAYFKGKLEKNQWNVSRTASEVGLHRQSLQEKLRELGIRRPGK